MSMRDQVRRLPPVRRLESRRWEAGQRRRIDESIDDPATRALFAGGERLPDGYGAGFSERVVEFPWVLGQAPAGRVLDAGSALNHRHVLDRLLPRVEELHIVTLAPEDQAFTELGVSYLYADLRDLPLRDGAYDTIVSISTLEHVGMDNTAYGAKGASAAPDARAELRRAVGELRRLLAPGGRLLVTVPYGRREDHGWLRHFDSADLDDLIAAAGDVRSEVMVYAADERGAWQVSDRDAAADRSYGAHKATAVACVALHA